MQNPAKWLKSAIVKIATAKIASAKIAVVNAKDAKTNE